MRISFHFFPELHGAHAALSGHESEIVVPDLFHRRSPPPRRHRRRDQDPVAANDASATTC
jgi:hypothetical protein